MFFLRKLFSQVDSKIYESGEKFTICHPIIFQSQFFLLLARVFCVSIFLTLIFSRRQNFLLPSIAQLLTRVFSPDLAPKAFSSSESLLAPNGSPDFRLAAQDFVWAPDFGNANGSAAAGGMMSSFREHASIGKGTYKQGFRRGREYGRDGRD